MAKSRLRYEGVQGLRFVAALLVVITHSTFYTNERLDPSVAVWEGGTIGVPIFFSISGFVMMISASTLVGTPDGWKFFGMRRLVRIVPMYWIATTAKLATLVLVPSAILHARLDPGSTILSYLFLPSRNIDGRVEPLLGVGWTLVFEMFFYAVFAIALLIRANPLYFCGAILTALAIGSAFRGDEWPTWAVYADPIVLFFLVGMVIGKWTLDRSTRNAVIGISWVVALWVVLDLVLPAGNGALDIPGFLRSMLVLAIVLAVVLLEPFLDGRVPRPLLFLGDASYSLYLFHPLIAPIVPVALGVVGIRMGWLSVILCVAIAVIATSLVYRLIEKPLTGRLQQRLPYVRRTPPAVSEVPAETVAVAEPHSRH